MVKETPNTVVLEFELEDGGVDSLLQFFKDQNIVPVLKGLEIVLNKPQRYSAAFRKEDANKILAAYVNKEVALQK